VEKWYVNDGQEVKAGDPIAQIVDNDPDVLTRMAAERAQVLAQIDSVAQAMAVARLDVERTRSLYADGWPRGAITKIRRSRLPNMPPNWPRPRPS
jgi:multidrug efflux pump subunit AcrA (membrane-fusion protein)